MTTNQAIRRGVVATGTSGVKGYAYRAPNVEVIGVRMAGDRPEAITGYASVWNRYSQNLGGYVEQIAPNAFDESLANDDQIASYNHDYAMLLGRASSGTLTLRTDNVGLAYDVPIDENDPDHMRVVPKIMRGDLKGSSFSMYFLPDGESWSYTDQGMLLCTVTRAKLAEVAPVVWPAYLSTEDDGLSVSLRSLAEQSNRDIGALVEAAKAGRLTEVVRSQDVPPAAPKADPEALERAMRARVRLAEIATR